MLQQQQLPLRQQKHPPLPKQKHPPPPQQKHPPPQQQQLIPSLQQQLLATPPHLWAATTDDTLDDVYGAPDANCTFACLNKPDAPVTFVCDRVARDKVILLLTPCVIG